MRIALLLLAGLAATGVTQFGAEVSLEEKVKAELEVVYFDKLPPYKPLDERLLELGEPRTISLTVLAILQKNRATLSLVKQDRGNKVGVEYGYLVNGIRVLGTLHEREALPLLIELADVGGPSDLTVRAMDIKLQALLAIGDLDAKGNQALFLRALKDPAYAVRKSAAEVLSTIEDPSVLTELEVAASQEPYRDTSKQIQAMADTLRARMNSKLK